MQEQQAMTLSPVEWRGRQKNYFDQLATDERFLQDDAEIVSPSFAQTRKVKALFEFAEFPSGGRILEVGCGTGLYSVAALRQGYKLTVLDFSPSSLSVLKHRVEELGLGRNLEEVICASVESMSFENCFDGVFCANFFHHVYDIEGTVRKMRKAVKEGGNVLCLEPNGLFPLWRIAGLVWPAFRWDLEKGLLRCTPENLVRIFESLGLEHVGFRGWALFPKFVMNRTSQLVKVEEVLIGRTRLQRFTGQLMIRGTKI